MSILPYKSLFFLKKKKYYFYIIYALYIQYIHVYNFFMFAAVPASFLYTMQQISFFKFRFNPNQLITGNTIIQYLLCLSPHLIIRFVQGPMILKVTEIFSHDWKYGSGAFNLVIYVPPRYVVNRPNPFRKRLN